MRLSYLFFVGRSPELAQAELRVFFPDVTSLSPGLFASECLSSSVNGKSIRTDDMLKILGGTVKIARIIDVTHTFSDEPIVSLLSKQGKERIDFGISNYCQNFQIRSSIPSEIKKKLEDSGHSVRFVMPHNGKELSKVAVDKQHIVEINIHCIENKYIYSQTTAVQDADSWAERDYGRPHADPKVGMLPPKISRIITNIALGNSPKGKTLLDPFVGMGTILVEGMLTGAICLGSDIEREYVQKAKENSVWIRKKNPNIPPATLFCEDATHVSNDIAKGSIDAIVTEPYMGTTKLGEGKVSDENKIIHILKGLEKLYRGCLRDWRTILKPDGTIIMAFPDISLKKKTNPVKKVIDSCEMLGYTKVLGPLPYSRPHAVVRRMFYQFRKKE